MILTLLVFEIFCLLLHTVWIVIGRGSEENGGENNIGKGKKCDLYSHFLDISWEEIEENEGRTSKNLPFISFPPHFEGE